MPTDPKKPAPTGADEISAAVAAARRPRMAVGEIGYMLAGVARVPAALAAAVDALDTDLFNRDEAHFVLFWRGVKAAVQAGRGALPADPNAARELVALKCNGDVAADAAGLYYTAAVQQAVLGEGGLLDELFAVPIDTSKTGEDVVIGLLARFVNERKLVDPLRRALAETAAGETLADATTVFAAYEKHYRKIAGLAVDPGSAGVVDADDFRPPTPQLVTTKLRWLDDLLGGGQAAQECYALLGPTSGGKCLAKGTKVLMFDGTTKNVEDVVVGDRLMGPDSTPRVVLRLGRGREMMYRVVGVDGTSYVVNESHILSVKLTPDAAGRPSRTVNLTVRDYLAAPTTFRHRAKGYRVGVEFPTQPTPVDPYYLGLWLADGRRDKPVVSKPDAEVYTAVSDTATALGGHVTNRAPNAACPAWAITWGRGQKNPLTAALCELDVLNNKHIPPVYLRNDRRVRLELLAGLLDGDGSLKAGRAAYEYSTTSERLAADVVFLARSLGFRTTSAPRETRCQTGAVCQSWRLYIAGDVHGIPCRVARKKARSMRTRTDPLLYGISIEAEGEGDYYGFEIDGDRLFLLGDFTVTHNTALAMQIAMEGAELQASLAATIGADQAGYWYYFTWELNETQLRQRIYMYGARVHAETIFGNPPRPLSTADQPGSLHPYEADPYVNPPAHKPRGERERVRDLTKRMAGANSRLQVVDYSGTYPGHGAGGVDEVTTYLRREQARGRRIAGLVVDYAGLAINRYIGANRMRPESEFSLLAGFVDQVRSSICVPMKCTGWVLHQLHGDAGRKAPGAKISHTEARGCRNFADNADFGLQLTPYNRATGLLTVHCTKHRRAPGREDGVIVRFRGEYGAFLDPDQHYVVDPTTRQIVPRDYLDAPPPGPGGSAPPAAGDRPRPYNPLDGI